MQLPGIYTVWGRGRGVRTAGSAAFWSTIEIKVPYSARDRNEGEPDRSKWNVPARSVFQVLVVSAVTFSMSPRCHVRGCRGVGPRTPRSWSGTAEDCSFQLSTQRSPTLFQLIRMSSVSPPEDQDSLG